MLSKHHQPALERSTLEYGDSSHSTLPIQYLFQCDDREDLRSPSCPGNSLHHGKTCIMPVAWLPDVVDGRAEWVPLHHRLSGFRDPLHPNLILVGFISLLRVT